MDTKSENWVCYVSLQTANSQRKTLEKEVRVRTAAMDSFDQMNNSLISANIDLQVQNQRLSNRPVTVSSRPSHWAQMSVQCLVLIYICEFNVKSTKNVTLYIGFKFKVG